MKITSGYLNHMKSNLKPFNRWNSEHVKKLIDHIDAIEVDKNRLIDDVAQLQNELTIANNNTKLAIQNAQEWQDELLKVQRVEKVVLPKDVTAALDTAKQSHWYKDDSDYLLWVVMQSPEHNEDDDEAYIVSLRKYANDNKAIDLAKAIIYGYTVEEEPEEPTVEDKITNRIEEELIFQNIKTDVEPRKLAQHLTTLVREVLAEDAVMQHESE